MNDSKFKIGDIVRLNIININSWINHFDREYVDKNKNIMFEISEIDDSTGKCFHPMCPNRCEEYGEEKYVIVTGGEKKFHCCRKDLIKATDREAFLYHTHGPEALDGDANE